MEKCRRIIDNLVKEEYRECICVPRRGEWSGQNFNQSITKCTPLRSAKNKGDRGWKPD